MFICDVSKKEIKFFDGSIFTKLTADFDILYVRIQKQYKKIENVFVGKGDLHIIKDQPVFFFSSLYMKRFELSSHFVEEIGIEKVLQYFYGYTIEEYISIQIGGRVEIYGEFNIPDTVQKILSEKELIEKSFFVDMCFDEIDKVYIAYARFPFIWGNYSKNAHIDNVSIGADKNEELAYQKALSEAIERVSASYQICEERRFDHLMLDNQKLLYRYYTYNSEDKILGNEYISYAGGKSCFLPEYITYYPTLGSYSYDSNSNGMATHISLQKAQELALLELVERDAFLYSWLTKSSRVKRIDQEILNAIQFIVPDSDFDFSFFLLESIVPIPTVLMLMQKDGKSLVSLSTAFDLFTAVQKAYQEGIDGKPLFDRQFTGKEKGVFAHIAYYLNPINIHKIERLFETERLCLEDVCYSIKNYNELMDWFQGQQIDVYFYEYHNKLNDMFERYTVRAYVAELLSIYFGDDIPAYVVNHTKLQGKILNEDKHPLG